MHPEARKYLNERGITDEVIARYEIGGDEEKIIIPVNGKNKYRTYPEKHYFHDKGFEASLFGLTQLQDNCGWCVLVEGEMDALRLNSCGIEAVSGTSGAGTFKEEWIHQLPTNVFICYDTDRPGKEAAKKIHWQIPGSRIVELPDDVKDVSDYLKAHTRQDFEALIEKSQIYAKPPPQFLPRKVQKRTGSEVEKAKQFPIQNLIKFNFQKKAPCPWHKEKSPSLHLYPDNHVHCFGCSKTGDAIDVYMALSGAKFKDAVELLSSGNIKI